MIAAAYMRARRKLAHWRGDAPAETHWSNALRTRSILPALSRRLDTPVPCGVHLEINTDCNYRCPFCPQSSRARPVRYITREGFRRVLDELRGLGFAGDLVLSVNNEPFLHPLLTDFCRLAAEALPAAATHVISNGSLIREEHLAALLRFDPPPRLLIDDYTPDHRIIARLREWRTGAGRERLSIEFEARSWSETLSNRAGNQPSPGPDLSGYRDITCTWPFVGLFLNPELEAFLCCSDYAHEFLVGDLKTESLAAVWRGDRLRRVREALLVPDRRRVSLCGRCDAEWWALPSADAGRER